MPRTCTICRHDQRVDIDKALVARAPYRDIAGQFGVSKSALVRHHDDHLPPSLVKAKATAEAVEADALLGQVLELRDRAVSILDKAERAGEYPAAVSAIREARASVELLAKLAGQLRDAPVVNLILSPEWQAVQIAILASLKPYPEARLAVAAALEAPRANGHA